MVDKIQKALAKLSRKELEIVQDLLASLENNDTQGIDIKQLKGHAGVYRARKGKIRIIFTKEASASVKVVLISRRSEKTYKDF